MLHTLTLASLFALAPPPEAERPQAIRRLGPRPWSLSVTAGARALGFDPVPASPQGSIGTELRLMRRRIFSLALGLDLGAYAQPRFSRGLTLDASVLPRFTAPFGLYGDLGLVVGGQASRMPGVVYRAENGDRLAAARSPVTATARLGLGVAVGYDFARTTAAPVRLFVRYRQFAQAPFMAGNGLPVMGIAELGGGIAVALGRGRARR